MDKKLKLYRKLLATKQDQFGFIESHECDSLLLTGLIGCVPGVKVDIDRAYDEFTGMWHRRSVCKPCYPDHSKSTISRDMLLGLAWYVYYNKRLDISEQIVKYALKNCMKMGKGNLSRIFIMPSLLATYAWISYRLGGPNRWWLRWVPADFDKLQTGFQAHLQVLHISLRNILSRKISKSRQKMLDQQALRCPNNALFQVLAGHKDKARNLVSQQTNIWPNNRLPSSVDRKEPWIFQRDEGSDWQPDKPGREHSGGDYIFIRWLIDNNRDL